ncbi:MAG TPA: methyltransferase, partial [Candidatus Baltobacteraceae bacterium]|nr:methyltransferase [Candidatus Baltobacteraceae bacterium]
MAIADPAQPAQSKPPHSVVLRMIAGRWLSQAVCVTAALDIPELLWRRPQNADELARALGAHPLSLERLLRALQSAGLFEADHAGTWTVTALGRCLTSAGQPSLRELAQFFGSRAHYAAWGALEYSVRSGGCAFEHINFFPVWESSGFNEAMVGVGAVLFGGLTDAYEFSVHGSIVDVGGGAGQILAQILIKSAHTRGVVFDLPAVIPAALRYMAERDLGA